MSVDHCNYNWDAPFREQQERAARLLPGGVSASIRANKTLGFPLYVERGEGAFVRGVDGKDYLDMCMSHGAAIHGHGHPAIVAAVKKVLDQGILCSYETSWQSEAAKRIVDVVPCAELVRFTLSGSEGVKYMLRVAREYTGRNKILKFEGHFHGYDDYVLYNYATPLDKRTPVTGERSMLSPYRQSAGFPEVLDEYVVVVPFNDRDAVLRAMEVHSKDLAAIILEPIAWNMGCVFPEDGFLPFLRDLTTENGTLLLFDEILSCFRTGLSCAQGYYGVNPDLCTLGKSLSGGLPITALTGSREVMGHLKPLGAAEHSGTYMGHLTGVAATIASLELLQRREHFEQAHALGNALVDGLNELFTRAGVVGCAQGIGDRFGIYFGMASPPRDYREVAGYDAALTQAYAKGMFQRGIYMLDAHGPKPVHHGFSSAHSQEDVARFLSASEDTLNDIS